MKRLTLLNIIVVVVVVGWYVYSPIRTVHRFETALREADPTGLERVIDFEAMRSNLKADVRALVESSTRGAADNPLASFGVALTGALSDGMVDAFITPRGLAALVRGHDPLRGEAPRGRTEDDIDFDIDRVNPLRFDAHVETGEEDDTGPVIEFRLQKLRWRAVRIDLHSFARGNRTDQN